MLHISECSTAGNPSFCMPPCVLKLAMVIRSDICYDTESEWKVSSSIVIYYKRCSLGVAIVRVSEREEAASKTRFVVHFRGFQPLHAKTPHKIESRCRRANFRRSNEMGTPTFAPAVRSASIERVRWSTSSSKVTIAGRFELPGSQRR